jgi:hypothetical protein
MTCSTASNSGKFAWSVVGIGKETTLKGITFRLSDFFSIKGYIMNPVSLLPLLVIMVLVVESKHNQWVYNFTLFYKM